MKQITRGAAINKLAQNEADSIGTFFNKDSLLSIFKKGIKGFNDYTNEELEETLEDSFGEKYKIK